MDAQILDLQTLFGKPVTYRIPQFQRPYAWKKEAQWVPLWEDVRNVAEHWLELKTTVKMRPHFMGAIVLQRQDNNSSEVDKRLVVDGQQRLTTLQLLIRATQEAFLSLDDMERAARLERLTSNESSYWGGDSDNETKIRQSNINDQRAFQGAIRNGEKNEGRYNSGVRGAYGYFSDAITEWLNIEPGKRTDRMNALEETLTKYMQIAAIDLDEDEQPHIIFETLNARGEPLRQSDLVKNTVMYEARVVDDAAKAGELWGMFENEWWRGDTKEGRISRIHIDRFLNYWMVVLMRREVTADRVAAEFRECIDPKDSDDKQTIEQITAAIRAAGRKYQDMEEVRVPGIETFLKRIKAMEIGLVMPPLLWLYTSDVTEERRIRSVKALESYLVRRMLCGLATTGLNQVFISLVDALHQRGPEQADFTIIEYLKNQTIENRIWPNDRMLREDLVAKPMPGNATRKRMVLEAIEVHLRGQMAEPLGDTSKLTVEHIMPQQWRSNSPLPTEIPISVEAEEARDEAIKLIGNLTLTTGKLNARLSNGPWREKRTELSKHSSLFLNKQLLDKAPEVWEEESIDGRSRELAEIIVKIWPSAVYF